MPEIVFISLFSHGDGHYEEERHQPGGGRDGRVRQDQGQDQGCQEVEVGSAPKLLEQVARNKGKQSVFGRVGLIVAESLAFDNLGEKGKKNIMIKFLNLSL